MKSNLTNYDEELFTFCYEVVIVAGAMSRLSGEDVYKIATDAIKSSLVSVGNAQVIVNYECRIRVLKACLHKAIELLDGLADEAKRDTQDQVRMN